MATAASQAPTVQIETSVGEIVVELYYEHAPQTCRNFFGLVQRGYYDGTVFHRIVKDFVIQGGDPTGTGRGGTSLFGRPFADEITKELKHSGAGILSMANSGKDTNQSQFFITLVPAPWLDGKHTIFGRVLSGMGTVETLGRVATDKTDRPLQTMSIIKAKIASAGAFAE